MKEKRKKEIDTMANGIEDKRKYPMTKEESFAPGEIPSDIQRKKLSEADRILATKKLEIPACKCIPVNGRIYVISVAGSDMKTPSGLILPPTFGTKKNEQVEGVKRYFVVAWDALGIPKEICDLLLVGREINPFLPQNAEEWQLPRVVDWDGNNIFEVVHYTELAGVSETIPEEVE
jgi:hypothetical protein